MINYNLLNYDKFSSISKKQSVEASQAQIQNRSNITSPANSKNNLLTLNIDQNGDVVWYKAETDLQ